GGCLIRFFFSSRRRHTRFSRDWSSDVCSSDLGVRASWYGRDASNPSYDDAIDPAGESHSRSLGFGGGGKTVDNTNKTAGITLTWTPDDQQTITFDYDASRQEYDNAIKVNDAGVEEYPVGTVDNYGAVLRIGNSGRVEPRAGY